MTSVMSSTHDVSLYCIPATFILAAIPFGYALRTMKAASGGQWSNVMPRQNFENLKGKVPDKVWNRCFRARSAHLNGLENVPLFASAVIAGKVAGLSPAFMNSMALQHLVLRMLYTALYVWHETEQAANIRSLIFFWSVGLPLWTFIKAGMVLNGAKP